MYYYNEKCALKTAIMVTERLRRDRNARITKADGRTGRWKTPILLIGIKRRHADGEGIFKGPLRCVADTGWVADKKDV